MNAEVKKHLEKAERSLQAARALLKQEYVEEACSRAYYAMFYAAQALLKYHGIQVKKHSAVIAMFGEHFAKTGMIDPKYHRLLIDAREDRELVDYNVFATVDQDLAEERVNTAEEFIEEVKC
ncbi:MAG: HEPN domain-containing protein [Acidobacteria bacterium]|nr:HEPN domain-containing protein [Acidobacteriota bacterium]